MRYINSLLTLTLTCLRVSEFRDIAAFVFQHATFSHPFDLVSTKIPHVPLGVGGWPLSYEERKCWANCPYN